MNRLRTVLCFTLVGMGLLPTLVARGQQSPEYVANQLIIKMNGWVAPAEIAGIRSDLNATVMGRFASIGAELWDIQSMSVQDAIDAYGGDSRIQYIEPNYVVHVDDNFPNDPRFSDLWAMHNTGQTGGTVDADIDAPEAWDIGTGNSVLIGIIDTGVDWMHEDLADNIYTNPNEIPDNNIDDDNNGFIDDIHGWDFVNNDNNPFDDYGHGTHVAGTIAGVGNNSIGVVGVCWSAQILPIKFLNAGGSGTTADAILSVEYATLMGARLTNNSWGGGGFSQALSDAIEAAGDAGYLFVAAAGNSGVDNDVFPHYPSSYNLDNIIAVASTTDRDEMSGFSNYGAMSVDLGAPGSNILSTTPLNNYGFNSGTSMATPHVSGALGLLWGAAAGMGHLEARDRILNSVDVIPALATRTVSGGRLNVYTMMSRLDSIPPAPVLDLQVVSTGSNTATLGWTATGDDGSDGTASFVDLRYSTSQIYWSNFDSATPVAGVPDPQPVGAPESFMVTGLDFNTKYYFAMRVGDERMNMSFLSNLPSGTTLGIPEIQVTPSSLSDDLFTGGQASHTVTISNVAEGTLDFEFQSLPSWISAAPPTGRVYDGQSLDVTLTFDATGLPGGTYTHDVEIASNDPDTPVALVSVELTVTDAPDVSLSSDVLDYGERFIGFDYPLTLTVTNIGTIDLNVTSVSVDNAEYSVDPTGFVLPPAQSQELLVTFSPLSVGPIAGTLSVHSDDPYRPQADVALQGIGVVPPDIAVSPASLSEALLVGQLTTQVVSIDNTGGSDLIFSIEDTRGGLAASAVSITAYQNASDATAVQTVGTGVAQGVGPEYSAGYEPMREPFPPKEKDLRPAGASASEGLRILLLFTGDVSEIQDQLLAFPDVDVVDAFSGTPTLEQLLSYSAVMVMLNTPLGDPETTGDVLADYIDEGGGVIMTLASFISPWDIRGRFASDGYSPFNLGSGPIGSASLGAFDATHPIMDGVTNATGDLLGATTLSAGAEWVADWTNGQPFVATKGEHVVAVNIFTAQGGTWSGDLPRVLRNAALWSSTSEGCWLSLAPEEGVIPANSSAMISVTFDATNTNCVVGGDYTDSILVNSNDPDESVVIVPVSLQVTDAPQVTLSDGVLDFGGVFVGGMKVLTLTVSNTGSLPLSIGNIAADNGDYTTDLTQFDLGPGEAQPIQVTFAPSAVAAIPGILTISSNDPDEPTVDVTLVGQGLDPPVIAVSPDTLTDDLFTGETHTQVLTIGNDGGNPLEFEIEVEGLVGTAAVSVSTAVSAAQIDGFVAASRDFERVNASTELTGANPDGPGGAQSVAPLVINDETMPGDVIRVIPSPGNVLGLTYLDGSLWVVVATGPQTLVELDPADGSVRSSFSLGSGNHLGLATDGTTLWVTNFSQGTVKRFTTDGVQLTSWPAPLGTAVRGIAWDGEALWIGGASSGTLYRTDTDGNVLETRPLPSIGWAMDMEWIDAHSDGPLWVADADFDDLNEFDMEQNPPVLVQQFAHPDPGGVVEGVAHDGDNMWLSGFSSPYIYLVDDGVAELRWLAAEPVEGSVPPGGAVEITVTFDAARLFGGGYDATLLIQSNDPITPVFSVPSHLDVTGAPDISVSETMIDFGQVFIGSSLTREVVVRNVGTDVLTVSNIAANHVDYAVDMTSFTLDPDESRVVTVTFSPQTAQVIPATLMIASDDPDEDIVLVALQGEGLVPPVVGVAPGSLADSLFTGGTAQQTLTILNTGGSDLIFEISAEGSLVTPAASAFPQMSSGLQGSLPDQKPVYDARFAGTQVRWNGEGEADGGVEIAAPPPIQRMLATALPVIINDPAGDGGLVDVTLVRGAASQYQIDVEIAFASAINPSDFGGYLALDTDQDPNTGPPPTFAGPGQDIGMEYELTFFDADFGIAYVYDRINGFYLGTVAVTLTPTNMSFSVPLSLLGDDDGSMDVTGVLGTNGGPTDWFPDVGHGTISGVGWVSVIPSSGTVPAGESLDLAVVFDAFGVPTAALDANLLVASNDPLTPVAKVPVHLDVTGAPDIAAPDSLPDFGPVFIGAAPAQALLITNEGTEILHVTSMTTDNTDFTLDMASVDIGPSTTEAVQVTFAPSTAGPITGTITIVSDDPYEGVVTVTLRGDGVEPPVIGVTPSELADSLFTGASVLHEMTIANTGASDLEWSARAIATDVTVASYTLTAPSEETGTGTAGEVPSDDDPATPPPGGARTTAITATLQDLTGVEIMWDRAHGEFDIIGWSTIVADLESRGATVTENFEPITPALLATVDLIWVTDMGLWTTDEIAAVAQWLLNGGGMLFETDQAQNAANAILGAVSAGFLYSFTAISSGYTTNIYEHPTTTDVSEVYFGGPLASFTNITVPAGRLVDDFFGTAGAVFSEVGGGRIAAVADEIFSNGIIGVADNQLFANQMVDWLASGVPWIRIDPASGVVDPNNFVRTDVVFDATGLFGGPYDADIVVSSNDPLTPQFIVPAHLDVTGAADIALSDSSLDFGALFVGASVTRTLTILNEGTDVLTVSDIVSSAADFSLSATAFDLNPSERADIDVTFSPSSIGTISGTLTIASNDPDEPTSIVFVEGVGVDPPVVGVDPLSLSDSLFTGDSSVHTMTVSNTGGSDLTFDIGINLDGTVAANVAEMALMRHEQNRIPSAEPPGERPSASNEPRYGIAAGGETQISVAVLGAPQGTSGATATDWEDRTPLAEARGQYGLVAHPSGKIYAFGGYAGGSTFTSLEIYDPVANTWSSGAPLPIGDRGMSAAVDDNGFIYSIGGINGQSYRYDPVQDSWTSIASPVLGGGWEASAVKGMDGRIYLMGGEGTEIFTQIYDPLSSSWSLGATMPRQRIQHGAALGPAGLIYVFGGRSFGSASPLAAVDVYNPATDTWSSAAPMPTPRAQFGIATGADDRIYIIGGKENYTNNSPPFFSDVEIYDPATDTWETGPSLPAARGELEAVARGGYIYAMGGTDGVFSSLNQRLLARGWLLAEPSFGVVAPGASADVDIVFDASGLNGGVYNGTLDVSTNDPVTPNVIVPAELQVTGAPNIQLSDSTFDYGPVFIGAMPTRTLVVTNSGTDPLVVSDVSSDHPDYTVDVSAFNLDPGASRDVIVTFAPTTIGTIEGTLTIESNDSNDGTVFVALTGTGVAPPIISVVPDSLSDSLSTGDNTSVQTLTIANAGASALTFNLSVEPSDGAAAAFTVDAVSGTSTRGMGDVDPARATSLDPFPAEPSRVSNPPRDVIVVSTNTVTESVERALQSLGVPYTLVVTPDFSSVDYTDYEIIIVAMTGGTPDTADIQALAAEAATGKTLIMLGGTNYSGFVIGMNLHLVGNDLTSNWTTSAAPHLSVVDPSHPLSQGLPPQVSFVNSSASYYMFHATDPQITVAAENGNGYPALFSKPIGLGQLVYFINAPYSSYWAVELDYQILETIIENALEFRAVPWLSVAPDSGVVDPAGSVEIQVTFDSGGMLPGDYAAVIGIENNDPLAPIVSVPVTFAVVGTPDIALTDLLIDFGTVIIGAPRTKQFSVWNQGDDDLVVSSIVHGNPDITVSPTAFSVAAGDSQVVMVTFAPSAPGGFSGPLTITSNDPDEGTVSIALMGNGVLPPVIDVVPTEITEAGFTNDVVVRTMTIGNPGGGTDLSYSISAVQTADSTAALAPGVGAQSASPLLADSSQSASSVPWLSFAPVAGTVSPDASDDVTVTLNAMGLPTGVYTADLTIASNVPSTPTVVVPVEFDVTGVPIIAVSDTALDFGGAFVGHPEMMTFAVSNTGAEILSVTGIVESDPQLSAAPSSFDVAPGGQQIVDVSLDPVTPGLLSATLVLSHNGHNSGDVTINVSADIIDPPVATVAEDSVFATVVAGETVVDSVTLSNNGGSDLVWSVSVSLTNPAAAAVTAGEQAADRHGIGDAVSRAAAKRGPIQDRSDPHPLGTLDVLFHGDHGFGGAQFWSIIIGDISARGATVVESSDPITPQLLAGYEVVWFGNRSTAFLASEITALTDWVSAGGNLLIDADTPDSRAVYSPLLVAMGTSLGYRAITGASGPTSNVFPHETTNGVEWLQLFGSQSTALVEPPAQRLVNNSVNEAVCAFAFADEGIVVLMPDKLMIDFLIDQQDNRLFANQLFNWFGGTNWLSVEPTAGTLTVGGSVELQLTMDAAFLSPGTYVQHVNVVSNDPVTPVLTIRVELVVDPAPIISTGSDPGDTATPSRFALHPNYPNPFNPTTTIQYDLSEAAAVRLEIFNIKGERVTVLIDKQQPAGRHQVRWEGKNDAGQTVATGVYFYRLRAGTFVQTRKMQLLK